MDDRPLGGIDKSLLVDVTDPMPEPKDFDIEGWLAGVRRHRRAVQLFARADLIARMEEIAGRVEVLPDGPEVDKLVDEFDRIRAEYLDGVWWVVEGRSPEWVEHFREEAQKAVIGESEDDQKVQILLAQLSEQIVTPTGVTVKQLQRLGDVGPGEVNKLVVAMTFVNEQLPESAGVLKTDFSSRRSAPKRR